MEKKRNKVKGIDIVQTNAKELESLNKYGRSVSRNREGSARKAAL